MYLQLLFNSIVSGILLALMAVGFNLIFNTTKVFHLAHGAVYVCGAYFLFYFVNVVWVDKTWGLVIGLSLTVAFVILLSSLMEFLVYRPLAKKNANQAITLISSMGIYTFIVNLIPLCFGNETKFLNVNLGNNVEFLNMVIVPIQGIQLFVGLLILGLLFWVSKGKWGLKFRAVMSNETVASVLGVNSASVRLWALACGSILAATVAILRLYDTGIEPNAGLSITLTAAVAVIIGGGTSIAGTIIASLVISFLQTSTEWLLSAQWQQGVTFLLLIVVILWRTEGIVSFKMRIEE